MTIPSLRYLYFTLIRIIMERRCGKSWCTTVDLHYSDGGAEVAYETWHGQCVYVRVCSV